MQDYTITLTENGDGLISAKGNFLSLVFSSAPTERFRVSAEDENGNTICNINFKQGGFIKNIPSIFTTLRVSNPNRGGALLTFVCGIGEYEEAGFSTNLTTSFSLSQSVTFVAINDNQTFIIPANDSRKNLLIQTDENNCDLCLLNGEYQLPEACDFERPIKNSLTILIKKTGDKVVYLEEI